MRKWKLLKQTINTGNEMDYEHLFADSDIEETDIASAVPYPPHTHHRLQAANDYVCSPYVPKSIMNSSDYGLPDSLNCNIYQNRQMKSTYEASTVSRTENSQDRVYVNDYRHKGLCLDKDASTKYERKCVKPKCTRIMTEPQGDVCSTAGPSRLIDRPVDYRLEFILCFIIF